jgi:hypothetical protein
MWKCENREMWGLIGEFENEVCTAKYPAHK